MNKVFVVVIVIILAGLYWYYYSQPQTGEISENQAALVSPFVEEDKATVDAPQETLYELKNSIQGVIADSVQDDIQQAVENKMQKEEQVR